MDELALSERGPTSALQALPEDTVMNIPNLRSLSQHANYEIKKEQLSAKQLYFVTCLMEAAMDIQVAAAKAGVSYKTATQWVSHEGPCAELIHLKLYRMAQAADITMEDVLLGLKLEATREASGPNDKTVSHQARVNAWDVIARAKGMYAKDKKAMPTVNVQINIDGKPSAGSTMDTVITMADINGDLPGVIDI